MHCLCSGRQRKLACDDLPWASVEGLSRTTGIRHNHEELKIAKVCDICTARRVLHRSRRGDDGTIQCRSGEVAEGPCARCIYWRYVVHIADNEAKVARCEPGDAEGPDVRDELKRPGWHGVATIPGRYRHGYGVLAWGRVCALTMPSRV